MMASLITSAPGASIRKFTPKGRSVSACLLDLRLDLFGRDRRGRQEAEGAGVADRGRQLGRRHPAHPRLDDRVAASPADRRAACGGGRSRRRSARDFLGRGRRPGRGPRGSGAAPRRRACASRGRRRRSPARSRSARRPRRARRRGGATPVACAGPVVSKSKTPRLETTRRISWKRAAEPSARAVVADARDHVDLLHEHRVLWLGTQ